MAIRIMSKFETLRICKSLQAVVQTKLKIPMDEEIGFACKIWATKIGENQIIRIETGKDEGDMVTIALRGTTNNFLDDIERTINNGIDMYRNMCKNGKFLPGAGSFEIRLSKHLQHEGVQLKGLEQ
mmetsp:Transcript_25441/g.21315  ORF Transcript_25441/g.21315 Transcript_25441/m.21315 type:complete len:126 (-) Transcript_25441:391-768(-)